jgi:hypothetical protein
MLRAPPLAISVGYSFRSEATGARRSRHVAGASGSRSRRWGCRCWACRCHRRQQSLQAGFALRSQEAEAHATLWERPVPVGLAVTVGSYGFLTAVGSLVRLRQADNHQRPRKSLLAAVAARRILDRRTGYARRFPAQRRTGKSVVRRSQPSYTRVDGPTAEPTVMRRKSATSKPAVRVSSVKPWRKSTSRSPTTALTPESARRRWRF